MSPPTTNEMHKYYTWLSSRMAGDEVVVAHRAQGQEWRAINTVTRVTATLIRTTTAGGHPETYHIKDGYNHFGGILWGKLVVTTPALLAEVRAEIAAREAEEKANVAEKEAWRDLGREAFNFWGNLRCYRWHPGITPEVMAEMRAATEKFKAIVSQGRER